MSNRWNTVRVALAAITLVAGAQAARADDLGLVLRAAGFFQAESTGSGGTCTVPAIASGVPVSSDTIGLWDTFGVPTVQYPIDECLGWMELQNNMVAQGISITRVDLKLRIAGAARFRQFVPTRNGWPTACKQFRHATVFSGAHLFPVGTDPSYGNTGSGVGHVAFVNLFPMVSSQVIHCLRSQYAALPSDVYVSFPLIIQATATGIKDSGGSVKSNPISFTLNLLHLCGNGRIDPGEICDPNSIANSCVGSCDTSQHVCTQDPTRACVSAGDCVGSCVPQGDPMECSCVY